MRDGERIIIMDRDIPVAEVIPHREERKLRVRQPTSKLSLRTLSFEVDTDPLEVLMEDRGKR